jgi:hypothetical protein
MGKIRTDETSKKRTKRRKSDERRLAKKLYQTSNPKRNNLSTLGIEIDGHLAIKD